MKVLVLGASGFIGKRLAAALRERGDVVTSASLRDVPAAAEAAAASDAIVNLSGEPIAQRWSAVVKRRIEESRVDLPRRFLEALSRLDRATKVYVSASAVGYYGTSETETFVEESPAGNDFLARVCIGWEREALRASELGMRVALVRTGVALDAGGGALARMVPPFRLGMGGRIGTGRQWFSWIHVTDLVGIYLMALAGSEGPLNATAPNPVTNGDFTDTLAGTLQRPAILPAPTVALRMMLGEGANTLLTGQRVLPRRTQELGYRFAFPELKGALTDLL